MGRQVNIKVDAGKTEGNLEHLWRWMGYDECNYTYIPEGKALLAKFGSLGDAPYFLRTHFMFCTGNCHGTYKFGSTNVYTEDKDGNPVYDFTYYDMIVDAILESGNKPFLELGFMPMDLVDTAMLPPVKDGWQRYEQYKQVGWTCPPKDYQKWHDFIAVVVKHLIEKHGEEEVLQWQFELWNEPDIFYWKGTTAEYCKLYDYTEHAIHGVNDKLYLAGPAVTGIFEGGPQQAFFRYFLNHCRNGVNYCTGATGTRLDFITFHVKGGGFPFAVHAEKNVPSVESLVRQVKLGLDCIVEYGYQDREVVLSEADPDGWAAGGIYDNANMIFRNTEYYASYVASIYEKIDRLCQRYNMKVRPLAWAFMFPGERCFEGTRTFSTQGIDKAVFNLFKIYGQLGNEKLSFKSDAAFGMGFVEEYEPQGAWKGYTGEGEATDVSGFAARGADGETQIVIYSHCNDRDKKETQTISIQVDGLEGDTAVLSHFRIDDEHSNAYAEWLRQGSPLFPEGRVYEAIKERDGLERLKSDWMANVAQGSLSFSFEIPSHGISYIVIKKG